MPELSRTQHEDLAGSPWGTEPFYVGFTESLLENAYMPAKAEQLSGNHWLSWINMVDSFARRFSSSSELYVYMDSADAAAQFSVRPAAVVVRNMECTYAGETALGSLATGDNKIWLDLTSAPTLSAAFGGAWPTTPHIKLAAINMPASGYWLPQHLTRMVGVQAVVPAKAVLFTLEKTVTYSDSGTIAIATVPAGSLAGNCVVVVITAFNGTAPTLKVGDSGDDDRFCEVAEVDLKTVDTYIIPRRHRPAAQLDIEAILTPDGSAAGEAVILLEQR